MARPRSRLNSRPELEYYEHMEVICRSYSCRNRWKSARDKPPAVFPWAPDTPHLCGYEPGFSARGPLTTGSLAQLARMRLADFAAMACVAMAGMTAGSPRRGCTHDLHVAFAANGVHRKPDPAGGALPPSAAENLEPPVDPRRLFLWIHCSMPFGPVPAACFCAPDSGRARANHRHGAANRPT